MKWRHCIVLLIASMLFLTSSVEASAEAVLELPANLEIIEEEAFMGSTSLESVILPDGIKIIGDRAFANSSLVEIYLPRSLKTISENAFEHHRPALIIKGETGTLAETYANNHDILFVAVNHEPTVVLADSWEEFAGASIAMIQDYSSAVSVSSADATYATGRLIVKVEDELPDVSDYNITAIVRDPENHYLLQFLSDEEAIACADYLTGLPGVIYTEPDILVSGSAGDSVFGDEAQSNSWGVSATYADAYAADLKARGATSTVVVAVVDTGVDSAHPMLEGRFMPGYDFIQNDTTPQDGHGHGTHVSGTVVDCTPGLNVKVMPVRVLDNEGSGPSSVVGQGIRYAALNGASVINLSLGGGHSYYKDEAIEYALGQGAIVVVAAGNDNENTINVCPAHITSCITVSAVDANLQRADFGYIGGKWHASNYGNAVDIAAPGVGIKSSIPGGGYASWNGTSMATPHVSASVAMLLCDPAISSTEVQNVLFNAATDIGASGWDSYYGWGFLNLEPFIKGGPEKYIITYDANGGTGAPGNQAKIKDTNLTLSTVKPTKSCKVTLDYGNGYMYDKTVISSFAWWNTKPDGTGSQYASGSTYSENAAATLYAQWNDGTLDSLPTPTRDGYSFTGWFTKPTGGSIVTTSTKVTGNMTIYAHWEQVQSYTITYDANGGSGGPASQIKVEDVTLTLSTKTPSRASSTTNYTVTLNANGGSVSPTTLNTARTTSYSFKNWNTKADGSGDVYNSGSSYTANEDMILYAQWNSSSTTSEVTLPTPTRDGYSFQGWASSANATTGVTGSYTPSGDVTLYAIWKANSYTVTYNANGGTGAPASQTKTHGIDLTLSTAKPSRTSENAGSYTVSFNANGGNVNSTSMSAARTTSYSFNNWNTAENGSGTIFASGATYSLDANVTLYAQWKSSTTTASITLPTPTRNGYTFKGWATSSNSSSGVTGIYTPNSNVTLYATWEANLIASGTWGNLTWRLDTNGLLTISGEGAMNSFSPSSNDAWLAYRDSISNIKFQGGITSIGNCAFYNCSNLTDITIPSGVTRVGQFAYFGCVGLIHFQIPDSVTVIKDSAFMGCTGLRRVFLSDNLVELEGGTFNGCTSLESITIPSSVTRIGSDTFLNCTGLEAVVIKDGVTSILDQAFGQCSSLQYLQIPASVTSIGRGICFGCNNLTIYFGGTQEQWNTLTSTYNRPDPLLSANVICGVTPF